MVSRLHYPKSDLVSLCERHGITRLSFFGSVLRDDFDPGRSDIDVLVEFDPAIEASLTYFKLGGIVADLEDLLGREVDLSLRNSLARDLRDRILATAEVQYARA